MFRLSRTIAVVAIGLSLLSGPVSAQTDDRGVMLQWYRLVLELVRHTATYTPPVASRAFAYLGVTSYEVVVSGNPGLTSLAGQLNGLQPLPKRKAGVVYDNAVVMESALATLPAQPGRPTVVIAHTVKGKGVSFMENTVLWHYRTARGEEFDRALAELEKP